MSYRRRIQLAAAGSIIIHSLVLASIGYSPAQGSARSAVKPKPLVLALNPPEPDKTRRLIEGGAPATQPVEPTDLISDRDTMARDEADVEGDTPQPFFEEGSEFDELAQVGAVVLPPAPSAIGPPETPQVAAPAPDGNDVRPADAADAADAEGLRVEEWKEERPDRVNIEPDIQKLPAPFDVAQVPAILQPQMEDPGVVRGRVDGGVKAIGATSFEAHRHIFGAYMIEVRKRVERGWRAALQLRYSGTTPTEAVIECAIRPDGNLVYVRVVTPGGSASYASLCKEAIELSGPFPPFPFEIPVVYRSRNLEIRWKFSFL